VRRKKETRPVLSPQLEVRNLKALIGLTDETRRVSVRILEEIVVRNPILH
jgi:hypothetical protein